MKHWTLLALFFPALASARANTHFTGGFGITERTDDTYQWMHNNKPLYPWLPMYLWFPLDLWFKDKAPSDTIGDGVKNVWYFVQQ
ncbi:COG4315 family predicted lipoprotein [Enterovibrio calviensis]|uniref:hypothetical protein n=1 Tax=Enterovibrio calviensis TaxID=91359 RepID=UPI0004841599|nr:hypothetical protein [Enterovibrio calviensis]